MQVYSHLIYRTACHQYVVACHRPPILYRTIRLSIPMERGTLTRSSAYRTSVPIPGTGDYRMIVSLCTGGAYPSICTDTIALFALYCQHLFLSLFYSPFNDFVLGAYPLSIDTLYAFPESGSTAFSAFFYFFLLFSTSCRAAWHP